MASSEAAPVTTPTTSSPAPIPAATIPPATIPAETAAPPTLPATAPAAAADWNAIVHWWWLLPLGTILATLGGWLILGRRSRRVDDDDSWANDFIVAVPGETAPDPDPVPTAPPAPSPGPAPASSPIATPVAPEPLSALPPVSFRAQPAGNVREAMPPVPAEAMPPADLPHVAFATDAIAMTLEPLRMSASLLNTSLNYRLSVTNKGAAPLANIAIAGNMVSAHASLSMEQQLATDGQMLDLLHEIASLAPGESVQVTGDLRLPLSDITPIRSGDAILFIPLARFRADGQDIDSLAAFVIGETPPVAAAALLPFRLDLGPRIWPRVSMRRIELAPVESLP